MRIARAFVAAAALLLAAPLCFGADQDPCSAAAEVSDVQFRLHFRDGQAVFREGEIVPLVLAFSTSSSRYWLNTASYSRSGRLGIDTFCVDPEGIDPLEDYFRRGSMGGGLSSNLHLIEKPFTREAELNEWQRLPPGHYRLYVVSRRVSRSLERGETADAGEIGVSLKSNTVEFQVIPAEKAWDKEQVRAAVEILGSSSSKKEEMAHAARVLRFLGTRDATKAMAKFASGEMQQPGQSDLMFGLYSSPFPDLVVKAMRAEYAAPGHAIDGEILDMVVQLQTDSDPAWIPEEGRSTSTDFWERLRAHQDELMRAEVEDLASKVSNKTGTAQAVTLNGMLRQSSNNASLVQSIRPALIACWKDLPPETQEQMILYFWQAIDTPEMLPILRSIVAQPPARCMQPDDLRNAALKHIYELDPAEGSALIARDLVSGTGNLTLENIRVLSPAQIQTAVPKAVERVRTYVAHRSDYELIDRYGDASVLASVQAMLESRSHEACGWEPHLLRYLLRVAPEYGVEQVGLAMAARKDTRCFTQVLQELGDQIPKAEQIAVEALNDPDPDVQQDAVIALTMWGTADAEEPMWTRLERFHDEWAGRAADLRPAPDFQSETSRAVGFEQALASGIAWGHGWICPPEKLARLEKLALTDYDRRAVSNWMREWQGTSYQISSSWYPPEAPTFSILGYGQFTEEELRAKLGQFPRGTHFEWTVYMPGQIQLPVAVSHQEDVLERVRADAESHGVIIEKRSQP